jgi:dTMP kinase
VASSEEKVGPGILITFEGGEGAGKTTHITFLASCLRAMGHEVLCLREPGGTAIGESLRSLVLNPENASMCDETELLVYEAARAQIVREVIIPALARGAVVLLDRFYDSTIAYQVHGRGLPESFVRAANAFACQGIHPCRTILLTTSASVEEGLERATHHGDADRLEQAGADFHARVNNGFMRIAQENPERVRIVSSAGPKDETARLIFFELKDVFGWGPDSNVWAPDFFKPILLRNTDVKATIFQRD